jgi:carboxyl-terminal processing protease
LKYKTLNGRSVYGGGGIMPDYFVPLDTTLTSHYLNAMYNSNSLQEYTLYYADEHKDELEKMGFEKFYEDFEVTGSMLEKLVTTGKRNKVEPDYKDLAKNKVLFQLHIKAQIARKIWKNDGFFPIFNETNEILQQAVKLFDRIPDLKRRAM